MSNEFKCELCGEPMPEGEEMFKFHGYSGPCPKSPTRKIQMSNFRRENRYIVIKMKDALKYLTPAQFRELSNIERSITVGRGSESKPPLTAVVVEQDWPEYEIVWKMIEDRSK